MGRPRLTAEQRGLVLRLRARGYSLREIGEEVGCSGQNVWFILQNPEARTVRRDPWRPGRGRLTLAEREEISLGLRRGDTLSAIAAELERSVSTVSREVAANGGRGDYRAWRAHDRAHQRSRRPKTAKLAHPQLAAQVTRVADQVVVSPRDRPAVAARVPRRSDDMGEPRNHLQDPLRPGQGRASPRADPMLALRAGKEASPGPHRDPRTHPRHGDDQRAAGGGR